LATIQSSSKYRREAISLISEALGTSAKAKKEVVKVGPNKSSDSSDDFVSCLEGSATSLGGSKNNNKNSPQKQNEKMTREVKSDSNAAGKDRERKVRKLPLILNTGGDTTKTEKPGKVLSTVQNGKLPDPEISRGEASSQLTGKMNSTGVGENHGFLRTSSSPTPTKDDHIESKHQVREQKPSMITNSSIPDDSDLPPALPPRGNTTGSLDLQKPAPKKKETKSSIEKKKKVMPRPIPSRPSQVLQRMLDEEDKEKERLIEEKEKKRQQALREAEEQRLQAVKDAEEKGKKEKLIVEQERKEREEEEERMDNVMVQEEIKVSPTKENKVGAATTPKKSLPVSGHIVARWLR